MRRCEGRIVVCRLVYSAAWIEEGKECDWYKAEAADDVADWVVQGHRHKDGNFSRITSLQARQSCSSVSFRSAKVFLRRNTLTIKRF